MATRAKNDIQRAVRVILDQNKIADTLVGLGDIDQLSLDDMIYDAIPHALRAVLMAAPGVLLEDGKTLNTMSENATSGSTSSSSACILQRNYKHTVTVDSVATTYIIYAGTKGLIPSGTAIKSSSDTGKYYVGKVIIPVGTRVLNASTGLIETIKLVSTEDNPDYTEEYTADAIDSSIDGWTIGDEVDIAANKVSGTTAGVNQTQATQEDPGNGSPICSMSATVSGEITWIDQNNGLYAASVALPEDYLRILAVQMDSWDYAVDHVSPRGDALYAIQHSGVYSLRGTPQRPVAVTSPTGESIELFSSKSQDDKLKLFYYIPMPEFTEGNDNIEISDKIYPSFLYYCAFLVCSGLGDFNKANAMEAISMQYLDINSGEIRDRASAAQVNAASRAQ